MCVYALKLLSY